ncbi:MAG: hypothetical protein MUF00_10195, partial [Gemmatimonadaceae bacterium]|nr:hypothetical protein [Gemmatimonadaceae bacterium]
MRRQWSITRGLVVTCVVLGLDAAVGRAQRSAAERTRVVPAPAITVVTGIVRDTDGRPVRGAVVRATRFFMVPLALTTTDDQGRFSVAAPTRQLVDVTVDAPLSNRAGARLFVTPDMGDLLVTMHGERQQFDSTSGPQILLLAGRMLDTANAIPMSRMPDGRWRAVVPTDREVVRYRVRYGRRTNTNTPDAGRIESALQDADVPGFVSLARVENGVATIIVDPTRLPSDTTESTARVSNPASTAGRLEALSAISDTLYRVSMLWRKGDTVTARITKDSLTRRTVRAFDAARDPIVRQAYANTLLLTFWPDLSVAEARRARLALDPRSPVAADYGYPMALSGALLAEEFPTVRGMAIAENSAMRTRARELLQGALATPGISQWMRGRLYRELVTTLRGDSSTRSLALVYADSLAALPETSEQEVRMLMRELSPARPT